MRACQSRRMSGPRSSLPLTCRFVPFRLPYSFGLDNRLTPFLYFNARCVQLLKELKEIDDRDAEFRHCVVWSECLKLEAGKELFICCTTKKIVCIEVHKEDQGSSLEKRLVWSLPFPKTSTSDTADPVRSLRRVNEGRRALTLKLVNGGHSGVALYVWEEPALGANMSLQREAYRAMESLGDEFGNDEDNMDGHLFHKLGAAKNNQEDGSGQLGASTFMHKERKEDIKVCVVKAEFQHRRALMRIANAAFCLMEEFGEVNREDSGGDPEGVDKFGDWEFYDPIKDQKYGSTVPFRDGAGKRSKQSLKEQQASVQDQCDVLEFATWGHSRDIESDSPDTLMANEKKFAESDGGAKWLVTAHAQAMFVADKPFPELPHELQGKEEEPMIMSLKKEYFLGHLTLLDVNEVIDKHVEAFERMRKEEEAADMKLNAEFRKWAEEDRGSSEKEEDIIYEEEREKEDNGEKDVDEQKEDQGEGKDEEKSADDDTVEDTVETTQAIRTAETVINRDMGGMTPRTLDEFGSPVSNLSSDVGSLESIMSNRLNKVEQMLERLLDAQQENRARLQKLDEVSDKTGEEREEEPHERRASSPVDSDLSMLSSPVGGGTSTSGGNIVGRDLILAEQMQQDQTATDIAILVQQVQNLTELQREQHTLRSSNNENLTIIRSPEPQVVERVIERHHVVVEGDEGSRPRKKKGFWKRLLCCLGEDSR